MNRHLPIALMTVTLLGLALWTSPSFAGDEPGGPYQPNWESLSKYPVPEWFEDSKFGIYAHWGVYSVPAFGNEWYPRNMYRKDSPTYKHHVEKYGEPSKFGYKDFIPEFTAEKFDAEAWADLYQRAGAKFAGPVAEHHDGFSMWASKVNRFNAADMGPKRDVTGELVAALRKRDIKIITSFHHAFNIKGYYTTAEGWDTADPKFGDLYGQFDDEKVAHDRWFAKIKEVIDAYQPDQIWFDFGLGKIPDDYKTRMAAYYYNRAEQWGKPVVITRKDEYLPKGVGVLDIERGKMSGPAEFLWQTDDSVATNSWCWVEGLKLKTAEELVHELVDIVSKNGVLLLNVAPKADGTIPDDQATLLTELGDWFKVNGEAIYATRPWHVHGEGPNLFDRGRGLGKHAQGQVQFTAKDIRYTRSKDGATLYAICLGWPEEDVKIESVVVAGVGAEAEVKLLGYDRSLVAVVGPGRHLSIRVPKLADEKRPCRHAVVFKLSGFRLAAQQAAPEAPEGTVVLAATEAKLVGPSLKLENKTGRMNVGFWSDPAGQVHWKAKIDKPGTYKLRGEFAATTASRVAVEVAGQTVEADVPATGAWDQARFIDLGQVKIEKEGEYPVVLRPADPAKWKAVNLWQVQLVPGESK